MIEAPSPSHGERRDGATPDLIVLHYTAMTSAEAAVERLCDRAAEVSCHWLIAEDGRLFRLVDEARRAWHAGVARWGHSADINSRSIGIELANTGDQPFPEPQIAALEVLIDDIRARWTIPVERIIGHECCAPARKSDPGPRFDWRRLARSGRAIWLDGAPETGAPVRPDAFLRAARRFGYPVGAASPREIGEAFRNRFRPWDDRSAFVGEAGLAQLIALAERWPVET